MRREGAESPDESTLAREGKEGHEQLIICYGYRMFVRPFQSPPGNPSPSGFLRLPGRKTPNTKISPHKNPGLLPPPLTHGLIERGKCELNVKCTIIACCSRHILNSSSFPRQE